MQWDSQVRPALSASYTLSLHDALLISAIASTTTRRLRLCRRRRVVRRMGMVGTRRSSMSATAAPMVAAGSRSEQQMSELQSLTDLVFRRLLAKDTTTATHHLLAIDATM